MTIHYPSDYGYVTGGLEHRDLAVCIARARFSLAQSRKDGPVLFQGKPWRTWWRDNARAWIMEGKYYRRQSAR